MKVIFNKMNGWQLVETPSNKVIAIGRQTDRALAIEAAMERADFFDTLGVVVDEEIPVDLTAWRAAQAVVPVTTTDELNKARDADLRSKAEKQELAAKLQGLDDDESLALVASLMADLANIDADITRLDALIDAD